MVLTRIAAFVLLTLTTVLAGCSNKITDHVLQPVNVSEAQELVQGKRKLMGIAGTQAGVWVDSRPENDFNAGHIPGAINLPYERVTLDHKMLKDYDVVVVYGSDYGDTRADGMSKRLIELGHKDVRTLVGGLRAWKADGNPVESGS